MQPTSANPAAPQHTTLSIAIPRFIHIALFVEGLVWLFTAHLAAVHAAQGIATRLILSQLPQAFMEESFFLFLLLCGFAALSWLTLREGGMRRISALISRASAVREWLLGAAIGWGMLLVAVLPMMLAGDLHPTFWFAPRAWGFAAFTALTIAVSTLALEVAFRGYIFRHLIAAVGPTMATILLSLLYAILSSLRPNATAISISTTFLLGILFSMAYLRTHALWLGWGLHFAWDAAAGILLGLPVADRVLYSSIVDTNISGRFLITGGPYGPEAAPFTLLCVLAAIAVSYRLTRDYAWVYTHPQIVSAGYAMDIAPPAAHTAMEQTKAPTLVQILPTTGTNASTSPRIEEHLKSNSSLTP